MTEQSIPTEAKPGLKDLLQIRDFKYLWSGQIISSLGDSMTGMALMLLVNELTGSTTALATMLILLAIPSLTFGMVAGVYVDRLDRKKIMIVSDLLRGLMVLGFLLVDSADQLWILYVIAFVQAAIGTFFNPARAAIMPNVVGKDKLMAANSLAQTSVIIFNVIGVGVAGWLVGSFDGYRFVFIADSLTFLISMLLIWQVAYQAVPLNVEEKVNVRKILSDLGKGLNVTFSNRILAGTILGMAITMLGLGATNVLLVPLLVDDLQVQETWFAAIEFSQTLSMILSGSLVAVLATRFKPDTIFSRALLGLGMGVGLISIIGNVWHVMGILFLVGWFITPIQASGMTMIQTAVPDELRGRASAANNAIISVANLVSMGAAGILADIVGARSVFIISGAVVMTAGLVAAVVFRGQLEKIPPQADLSITAE
ncbi:MAG TPA: MFS transporter [Anaerolineales bacterium]|nr:MFS transporter [Anaerolineales bacterium]